MPEKTCRKRNIWTDPSPYGTYTGEPGNPHQWRQFFNQAWNRDAAANIVKDDSPYSILGIPEGSSLEEIKRAFRKLIVIHHPDKGGDEETCKRIIAAYVLLTEGE